VQQYPPPESNAIADDGNQPAAAVRFLVERAREFVEANGGSATEEALIQHIFGTSRGTQVWKSLFATVISHATDLRKRIDGTWTLARASGASELIPREFVAVDVETTGLRPASHRIIEVGLVRYVEGQPADRYNTFCNPGRQLPAYISRLTGIHDGDLAESASFESIATAVGEFIGGSVVVGHNVEFDLRFLNAELKRAGRQTLINDRIDTMALAMRFLPQVRRPTLESIARALGLSPRKLHRALDDANLAAQCALLLLQHAGEHGLGSFDELARASAGARSRPREGIGRGRAVLDTGHLQGMPRSPGVYMMRDSTERVIYVGKAKNLRERVSSYYAQPLGYTRKMDGLLESIARIDTVETGTELEALILEAQLIRRHQPRYNSALRAHEHYPYIRVTTSSPWPRICLAAKPQKNGDQFFGPYRNRVAAKRAVELLNALLPLRTCPRTFKNARSYGSPCLRLDLHQCLGPCVGHADRGAYLEALRIATRFLEGDDLILLEQIYHQLEEAADRQDFERARELRNGIRTLQSIAGASRRLRGRQVTERKVLILPAHDGRYLRVAIVAGGRIWASISADRESPAEELAERLRLSWQRLEVAGNPVIDQTTLDDTLILTRWLERHEGHPCLRLLEGEETIDWEQIAGDALAMSYETFAAWKPDSDGADLLLAEGPAGDCRTSGSDSMQGLDSESLAAATWRQEIENAGISSI
jgi:DNA polymerase III epsilon subunit family exonuclease